MGVLVLSLFEGGYQPVTALTAFTALRNAGLDAEFCDIYVAGDEQIEEFAGREIIAISIPLFDSLRAAVAAARRLRASNPESTIIFFGQYATINARRLVGVHCDYAIVGEWEQPIVSLARTLLGKTDGHLVGVVGPTAIRSNIIVAPHRPREPFCPPDRSVAPGLDKYPQLQINKLLRENKIVGGIETTRGCHHKCTYCSVYAAYDGKVFLSKEDLIVTDVARLVDQGMNHLTFLDAEFFNSKRHAIQMIRRLHSVFPQLTYDFTTRVDHIVENNEYIREMASLNVKIITSALEFPSQRVLDELSKEIDISTIEKAILIVRDTGIILNPTFIMFNPWTTFADVIRFYDFIECNGLEESVDPIQYETRLHLYKGSPLLSNSSIRQLTLKEHEFHYEWEHPDPQVDKLFQSSLESVEEKSGFKRCCLKC